MRKSLMVVAIAAVVAMGCLSIASARDMGQKSLYSRLGGTKAISAVVDEFVNTVPATAASTSSLPTLPRTRSGLRSSR